MFFEQIPVGTMKNFAYLVGDEERKVCVCIDPGWEAEKIWERAEGAGMQIESILLTHVHYDHSGAAEELAERTGAKIFASTLLPEWKKENSVFVVPKNRTGISEGDALSIGNIPIEILEVPGHQSDHLAFIIGKYLFTGDVLFIDSIGRTDLEDSDPNQMESSLQKLFTLSDDLLVCSGHDYGSVPIRTLGEEKQKNPFLYPFSQ